MPIILTAREPNIPFRFLLALAGGRIPYGSRIAGLQALRFLVVMAGVLFTLGSGIAQARTIRLVAFGDSLSAGYQLSADAAFPAVLEKALRADGLDVVVANAGVSGDTAEAGRERLDWSVPDGTDATIVELGANDMLRGLDPAITRQSLDAILTRLQARHIGVLLAGMLASPSLGADYVARFEAIYPSLAKAHGVPLYPFFLDGVAGNPALKLGDGMHPNQDGVVAIVRGILPSVEALVRSLPPKS